MREQDFENGYGINSIGRYICRKDRNMRFINGPAMTQEQMNMYFARIGLRMQPLPGDEREKADFLKSLQKAHIKSIPFENLDIMNGQELSLDREDLFNKIIVRRRGGVCSELNTLYNWFLESLGFDVTSYISRVIAKSAPLQANSHRIMGVSIGEANYISDAGFNYDHHRVPLLLQENLVQSDGECEYRFERDEFAGWIMYQKTAEGWRGKISFQESPQCDLDFIGPTFFAQHHLNSKINKTLKVSVHKNDGFYAIREGKLLKEEKGIVKEIEALDSDERIMELITGFFGIDKGEGSVALPEMVGDL